MFLTGVVITGGTLVAGVKVYREKQREKNTPWTVYAERMAQKQSRKPFYGSAIPLAFKLSSDPTKIAENRLKRFKEEPKWPSFSLFGRELGLRDEQLKEINRHRTDLGEISDAEKKANRELTYSSVALMLTTGGALFYPPLNLLSVPIILMTLRQYVVRAYRGVFHEKKVGVAVIDLLGNAGPLLTGHFFVAALAVHLSNLSRKLLIKTEDHSQNSLTNVFGQQPRFVWVQQGEVEVQIPFDSLRVGDMVVVQAGQSIPIDGTITSGIAQIDERALTGESQPVEKAVGDPVFASTLLLSGRICIQVEKTGAFTLAAQIGDLLNSTADFKSQVQSRGNKIVDQGALPTVLLSVLALPLFGPESALAMFFAAFGYHMRHAAPIAVLNYLRMASQNGVLIKDGRSLELLSEVETFVFDKTGTLTEEVPTVGELYCSNGYAENDLLTYAAAAEQKQTHPIAQAITREARVRELALPPIDEAQVKLGYGLKVKLQPSPEAKRASQLIRVGSRRFMEMEGIAMAPNYKKIEETSYEEGHSLVYVAIDNQLGGAIELVPTIRPEAKGIISALKRRKMSMVIISGDHEKPTKKLAHELGIEQYFAETLPQNKAKIVEQLQEEGKSVCFVGDGINDSIALKTANVSISLRGASTAATDSASIILMDGSLKQLLSLLDQANSLDANLKRGVIMTVAPGIICVGGVFFLHFSLLNAILLYYGGLAASIANAMWPLLKTPNAKSRF
ncbi:MAG: heavy metal translocating P-type ATPase [Ardenticatenaceae bacterium]